MTTGAQRGHQRRRGGVPVRKAGESFTSFYVDSMANPAAVRDAFARLPKPPGIDTVAVDDRTGTDIFGCRIAIDLTGTFDESTEGHAIARRYAKRLSDVLGALYDLLRAESGEFPY